jgi:hypothetical protein
VILLNKKLARLSLCSCGFPTLKLDIPLGQIYQVPRYNLSGVEDKLICGGCGNTTIVHSIIAIRDGHKGWLPMELFDWDKPNDD